MGCVGHLLGVHDGLACFHEKPLPDLISNRILARVRTEKYAIFTLCAITAFLSAFMENVGVVLMMAPVAVSVSRRLDSDLFPFLIAIAISSNVVTTLTTVADPPSIILAMETGMKPLDFYIFKGKAGLGTITLFGVLAAMVTLLVQLRTLRKPVNVQAEAIAVTKGASVLFVAGVAALAMGPEFGLRPGVVGLIVGLCALYMGRAELREMVVEFDWNSFFFIMGVFVVIYALNASGLLKDFAGLVIHTGIDHPAVILTLLIWISVALSSFMGNVPYTILMIPVCQNLAPSFGVEAWSFLYGMLVGTGIGGNITPIGATANVFACGILEKHGGKVTLGRYMKLSLPFSLNAVAAAHVLLQLIWM